MGCLWGGEDLVQATPLGQLGYIGWGADLLFTQTLQIFPCLRAVFCGKFPLVFCMKGCYTLFGAGADPASILILEVIP